MVVATGTGGADCGGGVCGREAKGDARMITCHDCGVPEGAIHEYGCDMEICPFCGHQLLSCDCCYEFLAIDVSPGSWAYKHGLNTRQEKHWLAVLNVKGRIPYIIYPNICARCGELWPETFHVPDEEWKHYVSPNMRRTMLCRKCYDEIKALIDQHGNGLKGDKQG